MGRKKLEKMTLLFICVFVTESRIKRRAKKTSLPGAQATIVQTSKQLFFSDARISVAAGKSCLPLAAGAVARLARRGDREIFAGADNVSVPWTSLCNYL